MAKKKNDNDKNEPNKKKKVKKKPVGRPKKRGRKKDHNKRRKKVGVKRSNIQALTTYNRVRSVLWAEHKDEFDSYRQFISNKTDEEGNKIKGSSIVSQVYAQCRTLECNDDDILAIYNQYKDQDKDDKPELPGDYYEPRPFWHLLTENVWDGMDERLWVNAPMLIQDPSSFLGILGEDRFVNEDHKIVGEKSSDKKKEPKYVAGYKSMFQPFVDYANSLQIPGANTTTDQVPHVKFASHDDTEDVYWNDDLNRWQVDLVICNQSGDVDDFGFTGGDQDYSPYVPSGKPEDRKPEKELPEEIAPEKKDTSTGSVDREITIEQEKRKTMEQQEKSSVAIAKAEKERAQAEEKLAVATAKAEEKKSIANITSMWAKGNITKKEMMELIKLIKS